MKHIKRFFILPFFALAIPLFSTEQQPDVIFYNNEECRLFTHYAFLSPLETYYRVYSEPSPFVMLSTGNYRGFVATWKLENGDLFLAGIAVGGERLDLAKVFFAEYRDGKVRAEWYSGMLLIQASPFKVWYDSNWNKGEKEYYVDYKNYVFVDIKNGRVVEEVVLPTEKYWKYTNKDDENRKFFSPRELSVFAKFDEYARNNRGEVPESVKRPETAEQRNRFVQAREYVISVYQEQQRKADEDEERQVRKKAEIARLIYPAVQGYDEAIKVFSIYDESVMNPTLDIALMKLKLKPQKPEIIDSVWWDVGFSDVKDNTITWNDVLDIYGIACRLLAPHTWLNKWKSVGTGKLIVLRIDDKMPSYIRPSEIEPAWRHAGLKGYPLVQIALWVDNEYRGYLFLGAGDPRALVLEMRWKDHSIDVPDQYDEKIVRSEVRKKGGHWLDYFHFAYNKNQGFPQYLVVSPDGVWKIDASP